MRNLLQLLAFGFIFFCNLVDTDVVAQNRIKLHGYVLDENKVPLAGATIFAKELGKGTATNLDGHFTLIVDTGFNTIVFSFIGYNSVIKEFTLSKDFEVTLDLMSDSYEMKGIEVVGEVRRSEMSELKIGVSEMKISELKSLPPMLGETDVLKAIHFLPGVQSAGEGNSGFYVRGGGPDQNLILMDNAVVYNASHLFGFFSVFNSSVVDKIELTKGGMPSKYGGRLASVLDISMTEGSMDSYSGEGSIGLIASKFSFQGPIKKNHSSFIISGRRTYIDYLVQPLIPKNNEFRGSGYYFYDLNGKFTYKPTKNDVLSLTTYLGKDNFALGSSTSGLNMNIPWGNFISSFNWRKIISKKIFFNYSANYSQYEFSFEANKDQFSVKLESGIYDWNTKFDLNYYPNTEHKINIGMEYTFHKFMPNNAEAKSKDVEFKPKQILKMFAHEANGYIEDEWEITDKLKLKAGIRFAHFTHVGPFHRFILDDNGEVVDTVKYDNGKIVKRYYGWEPRALISFELFKDFYLKAGYTQNQQFIHLASYSGLSLPTDLWIPSTELVKPQLGKQINFGLYKDFDDGKWEASMEFYHKNMNNMVEFREGATPENDINSNPDNQLTFGLGESLGLEFFLKKKSGKTKGWIGYTLARTYKKFEDLNEGEWFPAKYDRRHDLSIVLSHQLGDRWEFGSSFVYATGNAITLPLARFLIEGKIYVEEGKRNGYRMDDYNRLDLSVTFKGKKEKEIRDLESDKVTTKRKRLVSDWTFSIHNVYNKVNPYFIYFDTEGSAVGDDFRVKAMQVSLFPILPSITWNFSF